MEPYLLFNSVEVINGNRTYSYINNGLGPTGLAPGGLGSNCATIGGTYVSPSADPAPWYDSTKGESAAFLGFIPWTMQLVPSLSRAQGPSGTGGSTVGRLAFAGQLLQVNGWLVSATPSGNEFGERWLLAALHTPVAAACDVATATILPACPGAGENTNALRLLYRLGLVDYTAAAPVDDSTPWSYFRQVSFQMRSELPWMYLALAIILSTTTTFPGTATGVVAPKIPGSTGINITLYAGTGAAAGPWTITGTCTAGGGPNYSVTVGALASGTTLFIYGPTHDVQLVNAAGTLIGGIDALNLIAPFTWPEQLPGTTYTWTVALAGGGVKNANSSVSMSRQDREG